MLSVSLRSCDCFGNTSSSKTPRLEPLKYRSFPQTYSVQIKMVSCSGDHSVTYAFRLSSIECIVGLHLESRKRTSIDPRIIRHVTSRPRVSSNCDQRRSRCERIECVAQVKDLAHYNFESAGISAAFGLFTCDRRLAHSSRRYELREKVSQAQPF